MSWLAVSSNRIEGSISTSENPAQVKSWELLSAQTNLTVGQSVRYRDLPQAVRGATLSEAA